MFATGLRGLEDYQNPLPCLDEDDSDQVFPY